MKPSLNPNRYRRHRWSVSVPVLLACAGAVAQTAPRDGAQAVIDEIVDAAGTYVAPVGDCPPAVPGEPSAIGEWVKLPYNSEVAIVHGAVLPTGKVVWWSGELGGPLVSGLWDPETGVQTSQSLLGVDIFCASQVMLADGRLLSIGGGGNAAPGYKDTMYFDPETEAWTKGSDMAFGRWYPTGVTLADGDVLAFSGEFGPVAQVERYSVEDDQWTTLPSSANKVLQIYPSIHQLPDGTLFYSGTRWNGGAGWGGAPSEILNLETNEWSFVDNHVIGDRSEGFSVLLPERTPGAEPWRVMVAGGYANGNKQESAELIDLASPNPEWTQIADMHFPRNNVNGVILPDGNVFYCTGIEGFKWSPQADTLTAEMFDPDSLQWTVMDSMQYPGQYHSISLLLPDGRVLKAGGQDAGPIVWQMELYSPPYLFRGPRPTIADVADEVGYGGQLAIHTPEAGEIQMVSMVRLSTITHHTNTDQRFLSLEFTQQDGDTLTATAPADGNVAPPGVYMLFVVNDCGVPSEAAMVLVGEGAGCYADFDNNGQLNILDFVRYSDRFTGGDPTTDCNQDGELNVLDFVCFQNAFTAGCAF